MVLGPGLLGTFGTWEHITPCYTLTVCSREGDQHRKQRKLLNPVFSISHMRDMLPIFYRVIHQVRQLSVLQLSAKQQLTLAKLRLAVAAEVKDEPREIDVLNWMGRAALELIGQAGLGYSFDPLVEDIHDDYGDALKAFASALFDLIAFSLDI